MKPLTWLALGTTAAAAAVYAAKRARNGNRPASMQGPRIVILGAGFAGLSAARELRKQLDGQGRVLLIDGRNYHLFTPMLYQVAAWALDPYDIAYAIREFAGHNGIGFRRGGVQGVDFDKRQVQLHDGEIPFDRLIIALGSTTNFFGNKAAEEQAFPVKWLEDAVALRNWTIDRLDDALVTGDSEQRKGLLTFVVVGGGATGVETAAALIDLLHHVIPRDYPTLDVREARVIVVEMLDRLLGQMDERLADMALRRLQKLGVEVWLETKPDKISQDHVHLADGRRIPTRTVIWTAGVRAPDLVANLDVKHGKGGSIAVDQYLRVPDRPGVYAVGDNASIEDAVTREPVPLLAQAALQEGATAARNLVAELQGRPLQAFHYRSLGDALSLGRHAGALESGNVIIGGLAGWLGWRVVHLARLTSFRDKIATVLDWSWGYFYAIDTTRLQMQPAPQPSSVAGALHGG